MIGNDPPDSARTATQHDALGADDRPLLAHPADELAVGDTGRDEIRVVARDEVIDLEPFLAVFTEKRGFPPYDPRLMLKVLIYGYTTGVRSSRRIEKACHDDVAFRFLAANQAPDFRSVARFRRRHLAALDALFLEILKLCRQAGHGQVGPGRSGRLEGASERFSS
mgnify:CR=1 FL=1